MVCAARPFNTHTQARGDHALVAEYHNHSLEYTPNGGSTDLKEEIAKMYGPKITANNILVFAGGQVALQTAAIVGLFRRVFCKPLGNACSGL